MTDEEILRGLQKKGDEAEHDRVLRYILHHSPWKEGVQKLVRKDGIKGIDSEDVFQEAIIRFYENIRKEQFEGRAALKTYFLSIARNVYLEMLRKQKHTLVVEEERIEEKIASAETEMIIDEYREILKSVFLQVGERCAQILYYRMLAYNYEEIARKINSLGNKQMANKEAYRCRKRVRKWLLQHPELQNLIGYYGEGWTK